MYAIYVEGLKKSFKVNFKKVDVLKQVDLKVNQGEIYWFIGPNGAGKTTTIKCILGFLKYDAGNIEILGKQPTKNKEVFSKIGFAPENTYFYDHLTGEEFLLFMGMLAGMKKTEIALRAIALLEKVGLLDARKKLIKSYSKWMKQRLGIAAAIINDPQVIFFDEPMSWLDPLGRILVKDLIKQLKSQGKTIFFNTHILSDVQEIADRFSMIYNWKIICEGAVGDVKGQNLEEFFIKKVNEVKIEAP